LKVRVFYHDKCFDGASSAALFSRFYAERIRNDVEFEFTGLLHRAGALFDERQFDRRRERDRRLQVLQLAQNYLVV